MIRSKKRLWVAVVAVGVAAMITAFLAHAEQFHVDARRHVLDSARLSEAAEIRLRGGSHQCRVTRSTASYGGGGRAMYGELLWITGAHASLIPTDGSSSTCPVGGTGWGKALFVDDFAGDNSGVAVLAVAGRELRVDARSNVLNSKRLSTAVTIRLPGGSHRCRVSTSTASYGGGGRARYTSLLWITGAHVALIPTDGSPATCPVGGTRWGKALFVDDYSGDNNGSAILDFD